MRAGLVADGSGLDLLAAEPDLGEPESPGRVGADMLSSTEDAYHRTRDGAARVLAQHHAFYSAAQILGAQSGCYGAGARGEESASRLSRLVSLNGLTMPLLVSRGRVVRVGVSIVRTSA